MITVTVFGGTGFLGRRLVRRLATEGAGARACNPIMRRTWQRP